jgi:aldose 1-epimerase
MELGGDRLQVLFTTENVDQRRAPAGLGFHPFVLRRLTWRDDDVMLVLPAERVYPAVNCIPSLPPAPVEAVTDLRGLRPLGARDLDHCFTDLKDREIRIIYKGSRAEVRFAFDEAFNHAVIYAPNIPGGLAAPFVAVEPVTNANDGFNLLAKGWEGIGVRVLAPGERWTARWEISWGDI